MRILQVVHGFPPHEWAGTEVVTLRLAQALRARGHEVRVLTRVYDPHRAEASLGTTTYDNLPVFELVNNYTVNRTFRASYDSPLFTRPFLQVLEQVKPEVVHVQHTQHLSVGLVRMASAVGYPTVLSLHDFFFACHRIQLLDAQQQLCPGPDQGRRCEACLQAVTGAEAARQRFWDMQRVLRAPDVVLTPSMFLSEKMGAYFPELKGKFRTVPLGVDPLPEANRQQLPRPEKVPLRILYVGVLAPHKGAHILLEALKGLSPDTVAVSLYGTAASQWQAYSNQLRTMADTLPVKFCGTYTQDQLGTILTNHDVLVMPTVWEETFSLVTREALSAGLPVVAARRGALTEAVQDGVNGLLFEPENPDDLRRCLQHLLTEPTLRAQMGRAGTTVKTVAEYAQDIEQVYTEIIQTRGQHATVENRSHESSEREHGPHAAVKLSVCIPTYNGGTFLAEAIKSVLSQTFGDFELLIVDDCSTDDTLEIARSFQDPRIMIRQNDRQFGIPGNWNRCLALARGEYVCIFHQDDVMLPENLSQKVHILEEHPDVSFVHSAVELWLDSDTLQSPENWVEDATHDFIADGHRYFRKLLLQGNRICAPSVVARRRDLCTVGTFDVDLGYTPDYEMWLKLCVRGQVAYLSQPLLLYRWHAKNASHQFRFARGVEELQLAGRRALQYYGEMGGESQEQKLLAEVNDALGSLRHWTATLEQGKEWATQQARNWEHATQEREGVIQELRTWIAELEKGRDWLADQRSRWQRTAQDAEGLIAKSEQAKQWLEDQRQQWQREAEQWQNEVHAIRRTFWYRLGRLLRFVKTPAAPGGTDLER